MPVSVATIRASSLCAGTTTATRLPSSIALPAGDAGGERLPEHRRQRAEEPADQDADEDRRPHRARRRLLRGRRLHDRRALDVLRERELLLRRVLLVLERAEQLRGAVQLRDQRQPVERGQAAVVRLVL